MPLLCYNTTRTYDNLSFLFKWPKIICKDSLILSKSVADKSSFKGKSFINWLYLWTSSMPSFSPVSAMKLTVAWKRLACLRISSVKAITRCFSITHIKGGCWTLVVAKSVLCKWSTISPHPLFQWFNLLIWSLFNCSSIFSKALSMLSQKLISWIAVPLAGSRDILVTFWISLIQPLTSLCNLLRKDESEKRAGSTASTVIRLFCSRHYIPHEY